MRSSLTSRRPLCAACAKQVRLAGKPQRSFFSAAATARRPAVRSALAVQPRASAFLSRPVSQSSRAFAQRQSQPAEDESENSSDSDKTKPSFSSSESELPTFYELFPITLSQGPPPNGPFEIDVRALRTEFLRLQAAAHPDFHHAAGGGDGASGEEGQGHSAARARAEAASAYINEAYRTLASPLLRAQYLLRQRFNVDLAGDEATTLWADKNGQKNNDAELLMAVLEAREGIEGASSEADLDPLREENDARMRASEEALAAAFASDDAAAAQREAVRLRYWVNIDDSLRNWEPGKQVVLEH